MLDEEKILTPKEIELEELYLEKMTDGHINLLGVIFLAAIIVHDVATLPEKWYQDVIELSQLAGDSAGVLAIIVFTQEGIKSYFQAFCLFSQLHQLPERMPQGRLPDDV